MLRKRARGTGLTSLGVESLLIEELNILRTLEAAGAEPLQVVPVNSPLLRPVDIFQTRDYGRYFMVRAANMKLTIDKDTLTVVNISGAGCPDQPVGSALCKAYPRYAGYGYYRADSSGPGPGFE